MMIHYLSTIKNEGKYSISMSRRDGQSMKVLKMDIESGRLIKLHEIIRFYNNIAIVIVSICCFKDQIE